MPRHNIIHGQGSSSIALRAFRMSKALAIGSAKKFFTLYVLQESSWEPLSPPPLVHS